MKTTLCLALCIAILAAAPLTYPGPLETHHGFTALYALLGDAQSIQNTGFLPLALARVALLLGLTPLIAIKGVDALAIGSGALGVFMLARRQGSPEAALVASALYTLLPYRLMTTYIRGDQGETLFLGLLPCGLWLIAAWWDRGEGRAGEKGSEKGSGKPCPYMLYHVLIGGLGILGLWGLWRLCEPLQPDVTQASAYLFQIFSAQWGYGGGNDWLSAPPLQLGLIAVGLSAIALSTYPDRAAVRLAAVAGVCCALSIEPLSAWWPWVWVFNAPWQLLGFAGLSLSLLGGSLVAHDPRLSALPMLAALLLLITLGSYAYLEPRGLDDTPTHLPLARYADNAFLVDIYLTPTQTPITPGSVITATLLWQDISPFTDDYKVFVHLIDGQNHIWAQRDTQPLNGTRPTFTWKRGELLRDTYALIIPPAAPPNDLRLEIGWYRADDGMRLQTTTGADHIIVQP